MYTTYYPCLKILLNSIEISSNADIHESSPIQQVFRVSHSWRGLTNNNPR